MPRLVLLNGPPACGKSTLAARFIDEHPLALNLDVDTIRGLLGRWADQPADAGLAARRLAVAMATSHLVADHDVIVPQFLGRPDFIEQLEALATETGSEFFEVALMATREDALRWFRERAADPQNQNHFDASRLVEQSTVADPIGDMYDAFVRNISSRPHTKVVPVTRGNVDATYQTLCAALHTDS